MSEEELAEKEANRTGDLSLGRSKSGMSKSRRSAGQSRSLASIMGSRKGAATPNNQSRRISTGQRSETSDAEDVEAVADNVNEKRGMILPFQPLSISFDDVSYFVDMPAVSLANLSIPVLQATILLNFRAEVVESWILIVTLSSTAHRK